MSCSSPYCTPPEWIAKGKTSFGGLLLIKGSLMLDLSISTSLPLGKAFGGQSSLESGFLHLGGSARKDPYLGQSQTEACHCD